MGYVEMPRTISRVFVLLAIALSGLPGSKLPAVDGPADQPAKDPADVIAVSDPAAIDFFEKRIRPVLVEKCYSCHSAAAQAEGKLKGGLLLD